MTSKPHENGPNKRTDRQRPAQPNGKGQRLDVPAFYAAAVQVLVSGNDATVLFTTPHPAITPEGDLAPLPLNEPVVLVHMSLAGLKHLSAVVTDLVRRIEEQAGAVQSELARRKQSEKPVNSRGSISRH